MFIFIWREFSDTGDANRDAYRRCSSEVINRCIFIPIIFHYADWLIQRFRDFTINALFYNINESIVEDFTGKGLSDLSIGKVRDETQ